MKISSLKLFYILIINVLICFILNYNASKYGKNIFNLFIYNIPLNLKIRQLDADYDIYYKETELSVVSKNSYFPTTASNFKESFYVKDILGYCVNGNFLTVKIIDSKNLTKYILIKDYSSEIIDRKFEVLSNFKSVDEVYCIDFKNIPIIYNIWSTYGFLFLAIIILNIITLVKRHIAF